MSKRPKTQWAKNASPETYLMNATNPENPKKVYYIPLNKEHSQYFRHPLLVINIIGIIKYI